MKELKEIIKFPFKHHGIGEIHCNTTTREDGLVYRPRLLQIRGWGFFQYFKGKGEQLQDEFTDWVISALNEKGERDKLIEKVDIPK